MQHPFQSTQPIGKPCELFCNDAFVTNPKNMFVPLDNVTTLMLTAEYLFDDETVLVVTSLI